MSTFYSMYFTLIDRYVLTLWNEHKSENFNNPLKRGGIWNLTLVLGENQVEASNWKSFLRGFQGEVGVRLNYSLRGRVQPFTDSLTYVTNQTQNARFMHFNL